MMTLRRSKLPPEELGGEVVSAFYFVDVRAPLMAARLDAACHGRLADELQSGNLLGRAGEHLMLPGNKALAADKVLFVGGGSWAGLCPETYRQLVLHQVQTALLSGNRQLALCLTPLAEQTPAMVETMVTEVLSQFSNHDGECLLSVVTQ
jgi:hypothetical protein